nr:sigma-70 family RNA polymerase sigma factor [Roseicella aerolata]
MAAYLPIDSLNTPCATEAHDLEAEEIGDSVADPSAPTEADLHIALLKPRVADFLETLPARERDIVHRHFWQGQSQVAIACELGLTQSGVSRALDRVVQRGRAFFGLGPH